MAIDWSSIQSLVWDLDGTLVDSAEDIATAVNLVLADSQLEPLAVSEVRQMIGNGAAKLLDRAFEVRDALAEYNKEESYQRFLKHYKIHCCDRTDFYPGIAGLVNRCAERGIRQGVCTNKPHEMAELILSHLNIRDRFNSVIGGDSTEHRKPHPQPLTTCMQEIGANSDTTLMIGDSAADVGVARAAGVSVVLFPYGYTKAHVSSLGADEVLIDAADLEKKLLD